MKKADDLRFVLVFARDLDSEGKQLGNDTICNLHEANTIASKQNIFKIILTASHNPKKENKFEMADLMKKFLIQNYNISGMSIIAKGFAWGTLEEMEIASYIIKEFLSSNRNSKITLYLVSSWWHIPRIIYLSRYCFPADWELRTYSASSSLKNSKLAFAVLREKLVTIHNRIFKIGFKKRDLNFK